MKLLAQAIALQITFILTVIRIALYIPYALTIIILRKILNRQPSSRNVAFYKGLVVHTRKRPRENSFTYPVRVALLDLDDPPYWWKIGSKDSMTADEARALAGTDGPVKLLTNPTSAGYYQNPISVYYCYSKPPPPAAVITKRSTRHQEKLQQQINDQQQLDLKICIAEVTNTPWGERVTFLFDPQGAQVPKSLHVSPFMDMQNTWRIKANNPHATGSNSNKLQLSVAATHPVHGAYFLATLDASIDALAPHDRNELASYSTLLHYGFQPQRIAFWIYWQAVILAWKGVTFYSPPDETYKRQVEDKVEKNVKRHPRLADGSLFAWRPALRWPWTS